jgi:hypothetical protein
MKPIAPILFTLVFVILMCAAHWLPSVNQATEPVKNVQENVNNSKLK